MTKQATLYRMETDEHICPFGLKSKDLLQRQGYSVSDHKLTSREETDRFKQQHDVKTTPQTFIDGKRIGGYDALRQYFNMGKAGQQGTTYTPVITIFAIALLTALAVAEMALASMPTVALVAVNGWLAAEAAVATATRAMAVDSFLIIMMGTSSEMC